MAEIPYNPTTEIVQESLDFIANLIFDCVGLEMLDYWKSYQTFYSLLPQEEQEKEYGRIYNVRKMLDVVMTLHIASGLAQGKEISDELKEDFPLKSLTDYSRDDWKYIKESIEYIQGQLIRKDANAGIGDVENGKAHSKRGRDVLYRQEKVVKRISLQEVVAPLQLALKDQLEDETLGGRPDVDQAIIDQLIVDSQDQKTHPDVRSFISKLLENDESTGELELLELESLREAFINMPPKTKGNEIVSKIKATTRQWFLELFGEARFNKVFFADDEEEPVQEVAHHEEIDERVAAASLQNLRAKRAALKETGGDDPHDEAYALASQAAAAAWKPSPFKSAKKRKSPAPDDVLSSPVRKRSPGHLLKRNPNATSLHFEDSQGQSEEDEELSEPDENAKLSELPRRAIEVKRRRSSTSSKLYPRQTQKKSYQGRRVWTDVETQALREGIRAIGVGNWAAIKNRYETILQNRTSGQIKDRYRTMNKRGEI